MICLIEEVILERRITSLLFSSLEILIHRKLKKEIVFMRTLEITKLIGLGTINLNLDGNDIISIELRDRETILVQESQGKFKSILSDINPKHIIIHEDGYVKVLQGDTQGNSERLVIQFGTDRSGVEKEFTIYTVNSDTVKYNNTWLVNTAIYKDGQLEFRY